MFIYFYIKLQKVILLRLKKIIKIIKITKIHKNLQKINIFINKVKYRNNSFNNKQ